MSNKNQERNELSMDPVYVVPYGFKGNDKRPLSKIIEEDKLVLNSHNLTCLDIASALKKLKEKGEKGIGNNVIIDNLFEVNVDVSRGFIACPFDPSKQFRKTNISVRKLTTNNAIYFSDLSIHLIEKHCFFQGLGSTYRLEPEELAEFLEELF